MFIYKKIFLIKSSVKFPFLITEKVVITFKIIYKMKKKNFFDDFF